MRHAPFRYMQLQGGNVDFSECSKIALGDLFRRHLSEWEVPQTADLSGDVGAINHTTRSLFKRIKRLGHRCTCFSVQQSHADNCVLPAVEDVIILFVFSCLRLGRPARRI